MRTLSLVLLVLSIVLSVHAFAQGIIPELDAIKAPYLKSLAEIRAARDARALPITRGYLAALARLEQQLAADPTAVAGVKAEEERVAAKQAPSDQNRKDMAPALAELRTRYEKDIERSDAPFQQQENQLTRQYISSLDTLQRRLTAQNQIAKAAAVHTERQNVAGNLPVDLAPKQTDENGPAGTTIRASDVKAVGTLPPALASKIAGVATSGGHTRSESSKQDGETKGWADIPSEGALLVGFEFFEPSPKSGPWIRSLRPYFMTAKGLVAGKDRGKMEKVTNKIIARPGYAVAGFLSVEGKRGLQIIFMKIDPATGRFATDSASTYKSQWYGIKSHEKPVQIGGDGRLVIGVYGQTGADCDSLGLIQMN